jgi:peroxiredoxin
VLPRPLRFAVILSIAVLLAAGLRLVWKREHPARSFDKLVAEVSSVRGRALPVHRLFDLDGREVPENTLRRGRVLLAYVSTSCDASAEQARLLSRFSQAQGSGIKVYAVGSEGADELAGFARAQGLGFPILSDRESDLRKFLNVRAFPCNYMIEDGVITHAWPGAMPDLATLERLMGTKEKD